MVQNEQLKLEERHSKFNLSTRFEENLGTETGNSKHFEHSILPGKSIISSKGYYLKSITESRAQLVKQIDLKKPDNNLSKLSTPSFITFVNEVLIPDLSKITSQIEEYVGCIQEEDKSQEFEKTIKPISELTKYSFLDQELKISQKRFFPKRVE